MCTSFKSDELLAFNFEDRTTIDTLVSPLNTEETIHKRSMNPNQFLLFTFTFHKISMPYSKGIVIIEYYAYLVNYKPLIFKTQNVTSVSTRSLKCDLGSTY